jgi:hypothetical protein
VGIPAKVRGLLSKSNAQNAAPLSEQLYLPFEGDFAASQLHGEPWPAEYTQLVARRLLTDPNHSRVHRGQAPRRQPSSERQVYTPAAEGRIPCFKIGNSIRFDPGALVAWLRQKMGPVSVDVQGRPRARRARGVQITLQAQLVLASLPVQACELGAWKSNADIQ